MVPEHRGSRSVPDVRLVCAVASLSLTWTSIGCGDAGEDFVTTRSAAAAATRSLVVPAYLTQDGEPESYWSNAMPKYRGNVYVVTGANMGPPPATTGTLDWAITT